VATLEIFFDLSSPWNYLGFFATSDLLRRHPQVQAIWRPILVGGVFNQVNRRAVEQRDNPDVPAKLAYGLKDVSDWARYWKRVLVFPPKCGHPVNAVPVMRGCLAAAEQDRLLPFAAAGFEALWIEGRDLAQRETLWDVARSAGIDPDWLLQRIEAQQIKDRLRAATDELVARGGFGAPTFFVEGVDMYFGQDRLVLVEQALIGTQVK
jgi:2-hydroxychromene-2-carboxylate isomerase